METVRTFQMGGEGYRVYEFTHGKTFGRHDGPVETAEYVDTGKPAWERWYLHGLPHRGGGEPAVTAWHKNGTVQKLHYFEEGKTHRVGGPAIVEFDIHGDAVRALWGERGAILLTIDDQDVIRRMLAHFKLKSIRSVNVSAASKYCSDQ